MWIQGQGTLAANCWDHGRRVRQGDSLSPGHVYVILHERLQAAQNRTLVIWQPSLLWQRQEAYSAYLQPGTHDASCAETLQRHMPAAVAAEEALVGSRHAPYVQCAVAEYSS